MGNWLVTLLLPLAAWSGWWVAMRKEVRDLRKSKSREAYFEGLSFLLNDQTGQAIDVFLSMAEIDQQTFDNQLTLGTLFRKRGELDRALHLHQQLLDYPNATPLQRQSVAYELAEDCIQAGMYEQAKNLLESLRDEHFRLKDVLNALYRLYERTADWQGAIKARELWQNSGFGDCRQQIAHYYCEIAQRALAQNETQAAHAAVVSALQIDARCGRAYLMRAQLAEQQGEYVSAIHSYQSIAEQALDFLPEILPFLMKAYQHIDREDEYLAWLEQKEAEQPFVRLTLALVHILEKRAPDAALQLLEKRLQTSANPLLLADYLRLHQSDDIRVLYQTLGNVLTPKTVYQCNQCGFRQQRVIWHCPACHAWSSFRPVLELKLEQR